MSRNIRSNGYYHATPGRLRVRVTNLKNRSESARSLEMLMMSQPGVTHVRASALTGNVLVSFEERMTYHLAVLESLADLGHTPLACESGDDCAEAEAMCDLGMVLGKHIAKAALKKVLVGSPAMILLELL
jgi:hypothetical protein